ncbi:MAG: glycosyltransferase [Bacteroidaceae bacterium]|nr:glycosyltransferase [Bacteroidaceae bacterium]
MIHPATPQYIKETLRARGVCVVIPTYNNASTVGQVVEASKAYCQDVIVVNDGSTDGTSAVLDGIKDITVLSYERNRGKGYALKTAFRHARKQGFAYAVTLDADGQHYPEDIGTLLAANQRHPGALIVGKRRMDGTEQSGGSRFANRFANFWFWVQTGRKLSDTQSGYRLYPLKKNYALPFVTNRYEAELELMVFASWHGVRIHEEEVNVYYPPADQRVSHFRPGKDFARISVMNTILCVLAVAYGLPLRLWRFLAKVCRTVYAALFFGFFSIFVLSPLVVCYVKFGKNSEKKQRRIHGLIHWVSRFVMMRHGIPGTRFSFKKTDESEDFSRPAVIICNHQSHLDLMCQLVFSPKMIFLTNDWVWHNPFYGAIIRNAEYYPVSEGLEALLPKLRSLVERGYSIAVFPEGTRSKDCRIGRFHQGAFYLAEQLGVDILPMCLYGPGKVLPKGVHHLNKGPIYIEVGKRVGRTELERLGSLREQASWFRQAYIRKYEEISNRIEQDV